MSALDDLFGPKQVDYRTPPYIPPQSSYNLTAPEHKGLFGMHGTLRDIIGILGDGLSGKPVYSQGRHQEKMSDAMLNFTNDPLSAIQAMSQVDPQAAMDMNKQYQNEQTDREQAKMMAAYRQAQMEAATAAKQQKGLGIVSSFITAMGKDPRRTDSYKTQGRSALQNMIKSYGLEGMVNLPDEWDDSQMATLGYAGMNPNQQAQDADRDERTANTEQYRQGQLGVARDRVRVSAGNAALAHSDRQARTAETTRHNTETEKYRRDNPPGSRGKPKVSLQLPPDLAGKYKLGRRIN